jgi:hypothetical protein
MASKPDIKILSLAPSKIGKVDVADWVEHLISGVQLILSQSLNTKISAEHLKSPKEIKNPEGVILISILGADSKIPDATRDAGRHYPILLSKLNDPKEEGKIRDDVVFEFFSESNSNEFQILDPTGHGAIGKNYWLKLVDLAFEINKSFSKAFETKKIKVFLSDVGSKSRSVRDEIKRDLQRRGYEIVPHVSIPNDLKKAKEIINKSLKEANLSIHILGKEYGKDIQGGNKSIVDLQNQLAAEYCKKSGSKLKRVVWQSPDDVIKDQKQREFIDELVKSPDQLAGAEFLKIPIEYLKSLSVDILLGRGINVNVIGIKHYEDAPDPIKKGSNFLVYDSIDKKWAEEIIRDLKKGGIAINQSQFLSTVSKSMAYHKECLALCGSVILLADKASSQWVVAKMKDILKSPGFGREKDFTSKSFVGSKKHAALSEKAKGEGYQVIEKGPGTEVKALKETVKNTA